MMFVGNIFQKGKKRRVRDNVLCFTLLGAFKRLVKHKNISSCCSEDHRWNLGATHSKDEKQYSETMEVKKLGAFQKNSGAEAKSSSCSLSCFIILCLAYSWRCVFLLDFMILAPFVIFF